MRISKCIVSIWHSVIRHKVLFASLTVLIILPAFMINISRQNREQYLKDFPGDGRITFEVSIIIIERSNSGVGNEWSVQHILNNNGTQLIRDGSTATVDAYSDISITSIFTESDSIDDVGETTSDSLNYRNNDNYKKANISFTNNVTVEETGGRANSDASAEFTCTYTLKRVIPEHMNFWHFLYYGENVAATDAFWLTLIFAISFTLFLYTLIRQHKEKVWREAEKLRIEQQELAERQANEERKKHLLVSAAQQLAVRFQGDKGSMLNAISRRDEFLPKFLDESDYKIFSAIISIPDNVTFDPSGLPIKGCVTPLTPYGSLTVYTSLSGKRVHKRYGCCGASKPEHLYKFASYYPFCSKCILENEEPHGIPAWFELMHRFDMGDILNLREILTCKQKSEKSYIYATAANGLRVRIPEDKYESWKKAQDEIRAGKRQPSQETAERLRSLLEDFPTQ